jgi:hypothetical protein
VVLLEKMKPSADWDGADVSLFQIYQNLSQKKHRTLLSFTVVAAMAVLAF